MMEIVRSEQSFDLPSETGIGLGNFDGLHIGHMALINTLIHESRFNALSPIVFTFVKHPDHILRKTLYQPLITSGEYKAELLSKLDIDYLYLQAFDEDFSRILPEDFIEEILLEKLHAKLVVVGFNYHFGYKGRGDTELLKKYGEKFGFRVIVVPPVQVNSETVSSTLIRHHIQKGNMERVFQLLGRHFSIPGKVAGGKRIGRELGFPTANLYPEPEMVIPASGVYITKTKLNKVWLNGLTNIGISPTIRQDGGVSIETHLLDYTGELYGEHIEVSFIRRIRTEKRFDSKEALMGQIKNDVDKARSYFCLTHG
jgi:riboflavin kinase/FMN adenylyltransferase